MIWTILSKFYFRPPFHNKCRLNAATKHHCSQSHLRGAELRVDFDDDAKLSELLFLLVMQSLQYFLPLDLELDFIVTLAIFRRSN